MSARTPGDLDEDEMYGWIEAQAAMGARRAGSSADALNEDFLEQKLRDFGLSKVRREPIPITFSEARAWRLEVGDRSGVSAIEAYPIPYTAFVDPAEPLDLVYADPKKLTEGSARWKGKVVVTEVSFPPLDAGLLTRIGLGTYDPEDALQHVKHPATFVRLGWHIYQRAARWGAAGFIGVLPDQPGGSCQMYAPYGFREKDFLDKPIPGFWVRREDGPRILALARSGRGVGRLAIAGERREGVTHNIIGEIPGSGAEEAVILACHHDSPFVSPVEDGTGVAVVLSIAKHFARKHALRRTLIVAFTAGHFYGSIGTRTLIEKFHKHELGPIALEIHIEHVALEAVEDEAQQLVASGGPEPTGIFVPMNRKMVELVLDSVRANELDRTILLPPEGPLGDFPPTDGGDWYAAGVPVINSISNPVYLLTSDDAMKWVDRSRLGKTARAFSEIIAKVDRLQRHEIRAVDFPFRKLLMMVLRRVLKARTTAFGIRPVH